jgi:hypothetical protein
MGAGALVMRKSREGSDGMKDRREPMAFERGGKVEGKKEL